MRRDQSKYYQYASFFFLTISLTIILIAPFGVIEGALRDIYKVYV